MIKQSISQYYNSIDQYKRYGHTRNESSVRRAFANLLEEYCRTKGLTLVDELPLKHSQKRPDGTVKDALNLDWGHWESKDIKDNLDQEIENKLALGYPKFNIIFENTEQIVLIRHGSKIMRCQMQDADKLDKLLTEFISYVRPEVKEFHLAVEKFKQDIPDIVQALRTMINEQGRTNKQFKKATKEFYELCKESINPDITENNIKEMLIQHILTAEIFNTVFGDSHFHRENNIAEKLESVVNTFFTGQVRYNTLASIDSYYKAIKREASNIDNHHEKQKFLKVIYENFYKAYNPKGADRLGIVYTPSEIVRFMIESTDWLLGKHFEKSLAEENVEILDPATGTGTFITDIIEYIPNQYLEYKYKNEIHACEIAILPYYIANLNIEFTYQQKTGNYCPFKNIVFVDTLENMGFLYDKKQLTIENFGFSPENIERIKKQNERKISVIIGNPPYNANQMNENDNNKNKEYPEIDKRIKDTYIKESTAQKTKLYDMYSRFFRWASDRINDNGIIAFITNRSYIDSHTFDGFRKTVTKEFDDIYIVDTQSDVRKNPKIAGTTHNVFGIQTGVAIMFLVRIASNKKKKASIHYFTLTDEMRKREKLEWFGYNKIVNIPFQGIVSDKQNNWLNITDNDFDELIPVASNSASLFNFYTNGVNTARDEWVFAIKRGELINKVKFFIDTFNKTTEVIRDHDEKHINQLLDYSIKWSEFLKNLLLRFENNKKLKLKFKSNIIKKYSYRPFYNILYYAEMLMSDRMTNNHFILFGKKLELSNTLICISGSSIAKPFQTLVVDKLFSFDFLEKTQCLPLYRYEPDGTRTDNITDWGLKQFTDHYQDKNISKEDIFHYTYAVLHNPAYRKKYEINLKREFPRLPFYRDFYKWVKWGHELMELHINYETIAPSPLNIHKTAEKENPKAKLKAIPEQGKIILDENTSITGVPLKAWDYKLGNRSGLHWILDQYKEKTPKDKTIAEKFNTYKFADYKETVIDLLKRVCTVSVKTLEIMEKMGLEETHNK